MVLLQCACLLLYQVLLKSLQCAYNEPACLLPKCPLIAYNVRIQCACLLPSAASYNAHAQQLVSLKSVTKVSPYLSTVSPSLVPRPETALGTRLQCPYTYQQCPPAPYLSTVLVNNVSILVNSVPVLVNSVLILVNNVPLLS